MLHGFRRSILYLSTDIWRSYQCIHGIYETQDPTKWEYDVTCINVLEAYFVLDNTAEDTLPEGMKEHPEEEVVIDQEVFSSLMWAALHDCTNFIFFMDS